MIRVLADSPRDARRIAAAVGEKAKIVKDADEFTNGDGHVACLILGCRHPVPAERIELLRHIEQNGLWIPLILVTDPELEAVRRMNGVKASAIVWFADLETELPPEIEAARGSIPLLRLAEQAEKMTQPPALRTALAHSLRVATDRPVRGVKELAAATGYSPITLSKAFSRWQHGRSTLSQFLEALVILRAMQLRSSGMNWKRVSPRLGFALETLHRKSKRWTGRTLVQLERVPPDRLLTALVEQYLRPPEPGAPPEPVANVGSPKAQTIFGQRDIGESLTKSMQPLEATAADSQSAALRNQSHARLVVGRAKTDTIFFKGVRTMSNRPKIGLGIALLAGWQCEG